MANSAWSVLVGVELDTTSNKIQSQLNKLSKDLTINLDSKQAKEGIENLGDSVENTSLTFQAANMIFSKTIDIIMSMTDEVYALDTALTEFKKVSDLSGDALDSYVDKLNQMGDSVARTG